MVNAPKSLVSKSNKHRICKRIAKMDGLDHSNHLKKKWTEKNESICFYTNTQREYTQIYAYRKPWNKNADLRIVSI